MRNIILIFTILAAFATSAQEKPAQSYSFSLQQAIAHALEHNYSVINAGRDIEISKEKKWETTAAGLPQVNAGIDYTNNIEIPLSVVPAKFFDENAPDGTFVAVPFSPRHNVMARATLSQLIFDGSYIVALQASKTYLKYYENAKKKTDNEVRESVINAYGNVLLAEESILVLEKNKTILDKTVRETAETFKSGLIEEEMVEQLQITQSSVSSSLGNAQRLRDIAYNFLKITLGMTKEDSLALTDKLEDLTKDNLDMAFSGEQFDVKNNINFRIGENFVSQRELEMKLQKSKALPSLAANLNFGYNAFGDEFTFLNGDQQFYDFTTLGVSLNVPIFSSFARQSRTQQAKIALEQARTQLTETEQRLKLQFDDAKSRYDFNVEEFANAKRNLELAERIERKQQLKFTEGLSTSFEFAEAQRQLYTAQQNYLQSMINVVNQRAAIENIINGN